MPESATTFLSHAKMLFRRAFEDFELLRDMRIGAAMAVVLILLQVHWELIGIQDWQAHKQRWILSVVLPFFGAVFIDAFVRLSKAPFEAYRDQEKDSRHGTETWLIAI